MPSPRGILPEPTVAGDLLETVAAYDRASDLLKQGLMARFGSIVGAYEWFDLQAEGNISFSEFEKSLMPLGIVDAVVARELFTVLDRSGTGKISLSEFLADAVKKLNPRDLDLSCLGTTSSKGEAEAPEKPVGPTDPGKLPPGRRALRAASILAFRSGRYDDAIVSSLQALGITSSSLKAFRTIESHPDNLVELLLLARAMALTNQMSKGEPLLELITSILLPVAETPQFPAHVTATLLCAAGDIADQYGKKEKAQIFYQAYMDLVQRVFGAESLVLGDALTIVAGFFLKHSEVTKAMDLASLAKDIREKNLTPPHARLADSLSNYATVLKVSKQFSSAISMFKDAAEQRVKLFGPSSIPVADAFFSIGSCFLSLGKLNRADSIDEGHKYLSGAHAVRLKLLGPSHADSLAAADALRQISLLKNPISSPKATTLLGEEGKSSQFRAPRLSRSSAFLETAEDLQLQSRGKSEPTESGQSRGPRLSKSSAFLEESDEKQVVDPRLSKSSALLGESVQQDESKIDNIEIEQTQPTFSPRSLSRGFFSSIFGRKSSANLENAAASGSSVKSSVVRSDSKASIRDNTILSQASLSRANSYKNIAVAEINSIKSSLERSNSNKNISLAEVGESEQELEGVVEYAKFPDSPFSEAIKSLGVPSFLSGLLALEPNLIPSLNFLINDAIPPRVPLWLPVAMRAVYFRRALAEEAEPGSEGFRIERFFTELKAQEKNLRMIFKLLNSINKTIAAQTGAGKKDLNLTSFTSFINSRTQNVALLEYFVETLQKQNPGVVEQIIPGLQSIEEVHDVDFETHISKLIYICKSMAQIDKALSTVSESALSADSPEGQTLQAVVRMKPEIKSLRIRLDNRLKILNSGSSLLLELFKAPKSESAIDSSVDCLDELYAELSKILFGDSENNSKTDPVEEQDEDEEDQEDEEEENDDEEEAQEEEEEKGLDRS